MTINERLLYKRLCPDKDFTSLSKLILCSIIDQFLQLVNILKSIKATSKENDQNKSFARFKMDIRLGTIHEIDILNSEETTRYKSHSSLFIISIS